MSLHKWCFTTGLATVVCFLMAFVTVGLLTPGFDWLNDYLSLMGAKGQPYGIWWNLLGFIVVGLLVSVFGIMFGKVISDQLVGWCLVIAGIGLAMGAIPADFSDAQAAPSKAHYAAICLSLMGWFFALARLGSIKDLDRSIQSITKVASVLALVPFIVAMSGMLPMPIAHRMLLLIVFTWLLLVSWQIMKLKGKSRAQVLSTETNLSD